MVGFTIITMAINAIAAVLCYVNAYRQHVDDLYGEFPWLLHILGGVNIFCFVINAFKLIEILW